MKIALISCSKQKMSFPCPAGEMYKASKLFFKASMYVSYQEFDRFYILSAKHGLLHPETLIDPYNETLIGKAKKDVQHWSKKVFEQLDKIKPIEVHFFAGENYRKFLVPLLQEGGVKCVVPLEGLGIGEQLKFYTDRLRGF